jgi:hypothetical protein
MFPLVAYVLAMLILNLLGAPSVRAETAAASASALIIISGKACLFQQIEHFPL